MTHHHVGRTSLPSSAVAGRIVGEIGPRVRAATGNISDEDGRFLLTLLEATAPEHVLEIGVASGTSTLMMLRLIEEQRPSTTLDSVDLATSYYADPTRPVAYLVSDHYPVPPVGWRLLTGVAAAEFHTHPLVRQGHLARHYGLAFIDAHHGHPWPTLDTLSILGYLRPGSWVALHDINLPLLGDYPFFGPVHLLQAWPGEALISDQQPIPNCGAIRLTDAGAADAAALARVLERPWDCGVHANHRERILAHLANRVPPATLVAIRAAFDANRHLAAT